MQMRIPSNKVADILSFFRSELAGHYDEEEITRLAEWCFEEFIGWTKTDLLLNHERTVNESDLLKFNFAVKDLKRGRPIQYVLGKAYFHGLEFYVDDNVLIPRPETEELVQLIIDEERGKKRTPVIVDIGTGSGCIAIALKKKIPHAHVYALDVSLGALAVAKRNATANDAEIHFLLSDVLDKTAHEHIPACHIIVSNPPYVTEKESGEMLARVKDYEPHLALFVKDNDSLIFYKSIAQLGRDKLKEDGLLAFEINEQLGYETCILLQQEGYRDVRLLKDMQGKDRFILARL